MKFSFSTNAFVRYSVLEAVERIARVGYEGVELLADTPHLFPDSVTTSDLERLQALLDRTALQVANINANTAVGYYGRDFWVPLFEPSLANPDQSLRKWRIAYSKKCIDMARRLGAPCVSITSGRAVPGTSPEQSMDLLRQSLGELLEYATERSIRLGIEYEPGLLIERYEEIADLIREMDSPHLGANLDLGHSHVLGEDARTTIQGLASRIFHLHIEDIRARKHYHLIPGTGDMDFTAILETLADIGYDGFATVELYTYPHQPEYAAREALRFLRHRVGRALQPAAKTDE